MRLGILRKLEQAKGNAPTIENRCAAGPDAMFFVFGSSNIFFWTRDPLQLDFKFFARTDYSTEGWVLRENHM